MLPASLILQAFRETGRTAPSVGRVDPSGDHTEALGLLLDLLSLSHLHSALPFWSTAAVAWVPGCLEFREFFFLFGVTPRISLSVKPLCPSSNVLSVSTPCCCRSKESPDTSNSSHPKRNRPASSRHLFPFPAHLLSCEVFCSKVLLFHCASYAHAQTQRSEASLQCPLSSPQGTQQHRFNKY